MLTRLILAALLLMLGLADQVSAASGCKLATMAEFPTTMIDRRAVLTTQINGRDAAFTVDSGAFYSLITHASAVKYGLDLRMAPFGFYLTGVTGGAETQVTTVKDFGLANSVLHRIDFLVGGSEVGADTVGLLGQNVLRLGDVEYDLPDGAIRLFSAKGCGAVALAYWIKSGQVYTDIAIDQATPLQPQTHGPVVVNGVRLRAVFDTGAPNTVLSRRAAARAGIRTDAPEVIPDGWMGGIGQRVVRQWAAPVASFKIGDEEIKNTRMLVADIDLQQSDMLVGVDFFLAHRIYVATSQNKMYLSYVGGPVFDLRTHAVASVPPDTAASSAPDADPTDAEGFARRGAAYVARHDLDKALADLHRATEMAPTNPDYLVELARAQLASHQTLKAMGALDQALRLKPDNARALVLRAELQLAAGDKAAAINDLDAADKLAAKTDNMRAEMAGLYQGAGRLDLAIAQYDLWIAAHGEDSRLPGARNGRCWTRALLGQALDLALADCNAALRMRPNTASFLDSRGLVQLRRGELDKAIGDYDAALKLDPKLAWSLYGRGLAEKRKGAGAQGDADIAAATALNPTLPELARGYGLAP